MDVRLTRLAASDLDGSWIGREMILGGICGALSDIEHDRHGRAVVLYIAGQRIRIAADTIAIYDTLSA